MVQHQRQVLTIARSGLNRLKDVGRCEIVQLGMHLTQVNPGL
jgi:hypothetical protein